MRALSASAALTSLVLGGWLSGAAAQSVEPAADATGSIFDAPAWDSGNLAPGVIPQPTIESPGIVTGITLGELYTDNLMLAPSGRPKQTSWITQVQPFIKSAYSSPRLSGVLDYTLTGYLYAGQSSHNQVAQQLNTHGTLVALPQHLFVDGTLQYGREVIDNQRPAGSGTFFLDNNHANITRGTLSPYWVQSLGTVGDAMLRYSYGRVLYDTKGISGRSSSLLTGVSDVSSNALLFDFSSPRERRWRWNFDYSDQRIEYGQGRAVRYAMAKLGTALQLNTSTSLLADVGKENNFLPDGTVDRLGADFWDVGAEWSNPLNHLKAMVGHRFYGRSYEFSWTHHAARLTTNLGYVEQPTDLNQQLLGQGAGAIPSSGFDLNPSLRERRVYLMKRATASAAYEMPKGILRLSVYDERRTYFLMDSGREHVSDASLTWQYNLGPFTTVTPSYGWQRYQHQNGQTNHNQYAQVTAVHQLDARNFASLRLRHDSRNVNTAALGDRGYGANVIFLQLTHLF
jgi:uncharacterized protein (PEP-CTERM system associated)